MISATTASSSRRMTTRPGDERFNALDAQLAALDPMLEDFCDKKGFTMVRNAARAPGRDLGKAGNPHWLICIYLDKDWALCDVAPNTEHTVQAISDFCPPDEPALVWRKSKIVAASVSFSDLAFRLDLFLEESLRLLAEWSPMMIMHSGEKRENLRFTHREYFPGGEKWKE